MAQPHSLLIPQYSLLTQEPSSIKGKSFVYDPTIKLIWQASPLYSKMEPSSKPTAMRFRLSWTERAVAGTGLLFGMTREMRMHNG